MATIFLICFHLKNCSNNSASLHAHPVLLFKTTRKDKQTELDSIHSSVPGLLCKYCQQSMRKSQLRVLFSRKLITLYTELFVLRSFFVSFDIINILKLKCVTDRTETEEKLLRH